MARRLLGNRLAKTKATIFGAWRSDALESRQARVTQRLEELAMQQVRVRLRLRLRLRLRVSASVSVSVRVRVRLPQPQPHPYPYP